MIGLPTSIWDGARGCAPVGCGAHYPTDCRAKGEQNQEGAEEGGQESYGWWGLFYFIYAMQLPYRLFHCNCKLDGVIEKPVWKLWCLRKITADHWKMFRLFTFQVCPIMKSPNLSSIRCVRFKWIMIKYFKHFFVIWILGKLQRAHITKSNQFVLVY